MVIEDLKKLVYTQLPVICSSPIIIYNNKLYLSFQSKTESHLVS